MPRSWRLKAAAFNLVAGAMAWCGAATAQAPPDYEAPADEPTQQPREQATTHPDSDTPSELLGADTHDANAEEIDATQAELAEELALELAESESDLEEQRGISIYGFADFAYSKLMVPENNAWRNVQHTKGTFLVGNLNVYLDTRIASNWRSLAEVRFTYLPNGDNGLREDTQGTVPPGVIERVDTSVGDYTDAERPLRTGSIEIERVWLEHTLIPELSVRVGNWLTPYGIWNVDHGSPIIIPVGRPFPIGEGFFPERQTGVQLLGSVAIGAYSSIGYRGTLSNGRGPIEAYRDLDENKAIGGRVFLESSALGRFKFGISSYWGRFTDSNQLLRVGQDEELGFSITDQVMEQYDEVSHGLDLEWDWKNLHVQVEALLNERAYTDQGRPVEQDFARGELVSPSDLRRIGGYTVIGYRTGPWELMPFVVADLVDRGDTADSIDASFAYSFGVNARPVPEVALKLQLSNVTFPGAPEGSLGEDDMRFLEGQVAWAF